jgi:L-asparaginase II
MAHCVVPGEKPMTNPVVVEVTRGALVESAHRGAGEVVDADGRIVLAFGVRSTPRLRAARDDPARRSP